MTLKNTKKITFDSISAVLYPLIFGVCILLMWQNGILHILFKTDEYILPYPTRIFEIIFDNYDKILENVISSVSVIIIGLVLGSSSAKVCGVSFSSSELDSLMSAIT